MLGDVVVAARVQVDALAVQQGEEGPTKRRRLLGRSVVTGAEEGMVPDDDLVMQAWERRRVLGVGSPAS